MMNQFRVDLHIHTVLSPCGSLDMSPRTIVERALNAKLDIIGITDHNSTKQSTIVRDLAEKHGLTVICGVEVTTSEEIHALAFFEKDLQLAAFQKYIDEHLPSIKNDTSIFGYQVVVDSNEMIIEEEERLLISALDVDVASIEKEVHRLEGLFIAAHIDKSVNSVFSQLGILPETVNFDGFGLSVNANIEKWQKSKLLPQNSTLTRNSDSHLPEQIGSNYSIFEMESQSFTEIRKALLNIDGRQVVINY